MSAEPSMENADLPVFGYESLKTLTVLIQKQNSLLREMLESMHCLRDMTAYLREIRDELVMMRAPEAMKQGAMK